MSSVVLAADRLTKSYDRHAALRELSFELQAGHVMGFLGPNGAGKTTAIRILTTILRPTSGRFVIDGIDSEDPARVRPRIGVLPETLGLPNQITGAEYISYFAQLYGRRRADARRHGLATLELVGMRERAGRLIRTYSHGMRQRLGIARALINDPVVLFLDEPVAGLDPRGQLDLLALLRDIAKARGTGIILCSHGLSEVEDACDDVLVLSEGRVVASGSVADVLALARQRVSRTDLRIHVPTSAAERAHATLRGIPAIESVRGGIVDGRLEVSLPRGPDHAIEGTTNEILDQLLGDEIPVLGFEVEGSRLQDAFIELTERRSS